MVLLLTVGCLHGLPVLDDLDVSFHLHGLSKKGYKGHTAFISSSSSSSSSSSPCLIFLLIAT